MKYRFHSFSVLPLLVAALCGRASGATSTCAADGKTDVTACLQNALTWGQQHGDAQLFLQKGTYLVSKGIVIPDRMELIGTGRGDANYIGTVIQASYSIFPLHGTVITMGVSGQMNFGVQVKNLTIDGGDRADFGLQNLYSMELSYGEDLLIVNYLKAGLDIETSSAQNSGPFRNLEIYPLTNGTTDTRCIIVQNVIAFRGIEGVTCNAGGYITRPAIALQLDGAGSYSSFHVEHFTTAVQLGSTVTPADGLIFMNGQFGPDVDTGVVIAPETPDQNLSIFGVSCYSCTNVLNDQITARSITHAVGFYLMGNGAGNSPRVLTSDQSTIDRLGYSEW